MKILWMAIALFIMVSSYRTMAQEGEPKEKETFRHRITVMMANSHIPSANKIEGQSSMFIAPTWGINYDYWFTQKWAIGLHNDVIMQQFKIEKHQGKEVIERIAPVAICAVTLFRPSPQWTFLLGFGREFEKDESFNMLCTSVEYGIELPNDWELSLNLIYDTKIKTYDTWMFGVGVSKLL